MRYDLSLRTSFFTLVVVASVTVVFIVWNYVNAHFSTRLTSYFGAEPHTVKWYIVFFGYPVVDS